MIKKNILSLRVYGLILLLCSVNCKAAFYDTPERGAFLQSLHSKRESSSPTNFLSSEGTASVVIVNNDGETASIRVKISEIGKGGDPRTAPVVWDKILVPFFNTQSNTPQYPPVYNVVPVVIPVNNLRISLYTHRVFGTSDDMKWERYVGTFYPRPEDLVGLLKIYVAQWGCVLQYNDNTEIVVRCGKRAGDLEMQPRRWSLPIQ